MDQYQLILKAVFEKAGIQKSLQDVQTLAKQLPIEMTTKLNSASTRNDFKQFAKEMANDLNKSMNLNLSAKDIMSAYDQMVKSAEKASATQIKVGKEIDKTIGKVKELKSIGKIDLDYSSAEKSYQSLEKVGSVTDKLKTDFTQLKLTKDALNNSSDADLAANYTKFNTALMTVNNTMRQTKLNTASVSTEMLQLEKTTFKNQVIAWNRVNSNAKQFHERMNQIIGQVNSVDDKSGLINLQKQFQALNSEAAALGVKGFNSIDKMKNAFSKIIEWITPMQAIMQTAQAFREMASNVKVLDDSLLELSKVSDLSAKGLKDVTEKAYKLGETVGKTGTAVIDATTSFKRAGYELGQSMDLAEKALVMTNVAEGIKDAGVAATDLISVMKGYDNNSSEFAQKILDATNQVSNTQAIDFDELIDGSQRLSAVANQAGLSYEQMLGTLTGANEILQNIEKTASGEITIFTRLQAIQLPDEEDVLPIAKLQDTINTATKGVVNVIDQSNGQLRNAYDILDDINGVWNTLDKNTQEGIAFAAGGTRQKSVFLSMMQNWDNVKKSVDSATDSMGSADVENQKYLDSLSGKVEIFSSAFEHLSQTVISSDLLKNLVDIGTVGVSSIDKLVNAITPLGTIGLIGGGILGAKNLGRAKMYAL